MAALTRRGLRLGVWAAAVLFAAGGCTAVRESGRPIGDAALGEIVPGRSRKADLLGRFGIPAAVFARHGPVVMALPARSGDMIDMNPTCSFEADAVFELFPPGAGGGDGLRVYHHRRVRSVTTTWFLLLGLYLDGRTEEDRLWTLVDEETGIVRNYALKRSDAPLVYGAHP